MEKLKTKHVDGYLYVNFLKRSSQCLSSAEKSLENGDYTASAICSIHSCIAAVDALCVNFLKLRHAGTNHDDAVKLLETIREIPREQIRALENKVLKVLKIKNMAEYEERLIKQKEAEKLCADAVDILKFAVSKLPEA